MDNVTEWRIFTKNNKYTTSNIGTENDKTWAGEFFFVQGADPQFGMMDMFGKADYNPETADWKEEIRLAKLAVEKVNQMSPQPRFFIICGDLTNQMPSTLPELKEKQIKDFKQVFSKVKPNIPLVCVCGNHDVGDFPTVDTVNKYRSEFGDDYFSFWCGGVLFIVLNSQYFKEPANILKLVEEQEKWLDEQLSSANGNPIVCFSHVPWFIGDVNEEVAIFNIPQETRIRMLEKLHKAGVRYMFCGHYHRNATVFYKELEIIVTSAIGMQLGNDKSGLRIAKVSKDKITHTYYDLENVPTTIKLE